MWRTHYQQVLRPKYCSLKVKTDNFTLRYINDVLSLNNSRFCDLVDRIHPIEFEIKDTTDTDASASYLDLHLEVDSERRLRTKLSDKRDDFNFPIVNFPFICSNIPAAPAYGVYISQLIRYSRTCSSYQDFLDRGLLLTRKLLNQQFLLAKLKSSLRMLYDRHHDLVARYGISVSQMTTDMFHLSSAIPGPFLVHSYHRVCNQINTTGVTSVAGTAYPTGTSEFTPGFQWDSCYSIFGFVCMLC